MRARIAAIGLALALPACVSAPPAAPPPPIVTPPMPVLGLERVLGRSAAELAELFGAPDLDLRERTGRRLSYAGPICVLDAYLYPPRAGAEPVVTYVDARLPDGRDLDRASCIAALARTPEARR